MGGAKLSKSLIQFSDDGAVFPPCYLPGAKLECKVKWVLGSIRAGRDHGNPSLLTVGKRKPMGWWWSAAGLWAVSVAVHAWDLLKEMAITFIAGREHSSTH